MWTVRRGPYHSLKEFKESFQREMTSKLCPEGRTEVESRSTAWEGRRGQENSMLPCGGNSWLTSSQEGDPTPSSVPPCSHPWMGRAVLFAVWYIRWWKKVEISTTSCISTAFDHPSEYLERPRLQIDSDSTKIYMSP